MIFTRTKRRLHVCKAIIHELLREFCKMKSRYALNITAFKTVCCMGIIFAALRWPMLIGLAASLGVAFNMAIARNVRKELLVTGLTVVVGLAWVISALETGIVTLAEQPYFPPSVWILSMWALFGSSLNGAFRWMKVHWTLGAGLGFSAGLLSASVVSLTGLLTLTYGGWSTLAVGAAWAVIFPLLALLSDTVIDSSMFEKPYTEAEYKTRLDMTSLQPTQ